MVRIHKVYTRSGDAGETGLVGGQRVTKDSARIAAFGNLDELNSFVGLAFAEIDALNRSDTKLEELAGELCWIQQKLFDLGAYLATPPESVKKGMPMVGASDVERLEKSMDHRSETLPPLESFVLPGGGKLGSWLHVCRTVCRRAERDCVALDRDTTLEPVALIFVNRLSDFFFVAARFSSAVLGIKETLWTPTAPDSDAPKSD